MSFERMSPDVDLRHQISVLGAELGPRVREATTELFSERHLEITKFPIARDIFYGPDPRHRLDIHQPKHLVGGPLPVFVYVHGGGFIGGDKSKPGLPYYDNIGQWAASNGVLGVNITYRYAPEFTYPSGAEDVARALEWIDANIHEFNADPSRVVLMGHSAGSAHVASFVATPGLQSNLEHLPRGLILSSGVYDPTQGAAAYAVYFGDDAQGLSRSAIPGICKTEIPLLLSSCEFDPENIRQQTFTLVEAMMHAHNKMPDCVFNDGHNHYSVVYQFGTSDNWLGDRVLRFIASVTRGTD